MTHTLPLSQWLGNTRADATPIAWLGDNTWTQARLRYDVAQLLAQLNNHPGERWALCFENSYLFIVALLATLCARKIPVIPGHSRIALLKEQCVFFDGILSDKPLSWPENLLVVSSSGEATITEQPPLPVIDDNQFIELFTSGSTGQPKRVVKRIATLDQEAQILAARFAPQVKDCRVVASVVPQHLYGLTFRIVLPMALGLPLHAAMLYYAEQLAALTPQYRYVFISSPAFLKRLDNQLPAPQVAMTFSAGGMLPWHDVQYTRDWLGHAVDEIYGSTETGILAWRHREQDLQPWVPFPGVYFAHQAEKYIAHSPLIDNPSGLILDDMLELNDDGSFQLSGRRGRVVKIEEKRISLTEVEQRLLELDGVKDAAALPLSRGGRQGIGALLVLDEAHYALWCTSNKKTLEFAWRQALLPWLEPVAIPRYWRVIQEIPVNSMNKRVYGQLQELFHETS
ncbi:AMP-dependent synthetase [Mangrovibacter phragmitis]|uniref:AMP-dependent synthetase n=1 Tax=Mangrovibacter phragmitis TaxID=1691903 RepID=A0A1B7L5K8_9ENTR|nr:AMP-binding protein [Mangrovibacter phragmitis]OAT77694.1 AMP-dependent synthetase [Mangrovibacter phragmitis]